MDFEELYKQYFNDVYLYIRRLSGDEHLAEEITSETFFKAMRSLDTFRGDCDIRVWLCQIAKHSYYSWLKKQKRYISVEEIPLANKADVAMEDAVANHDAAMQIQTVLHTLPEPYREVFMWRVFAELSFKQIGQIFQKTDNWACVTYHRARQMLKQRWEANSHDK